MRRAKRFVPAIAGTAIAIAVISFGLRNFHAVEDVSGFKPTQWAGNVFNVNPNKEWPDSVKRRMTGIVVEKSNTDFDAFSKFGIIRNHGDNHIDVVVIGDSHGLMWAPAIDTVLKEMGKTVSFMTADGTAAFFDPSALTTTKSNQFFTRSQLIEFRKAALGLINNDRPKIVIIGAKWDNYSAKQAKPLIDEIASTGARLILLSDPPELDIGDRNLPQFLSFLGLRDVSDAWLPRVDVTVSQDAQRNIRMIASACPESCRILDVGAPFMKLSKGTALAHVLADGHALYIDDDHLSVAGAELATDAIRRALVSAMARGSSMAAEKAVTHAP